MAQEPITLHSIPPQGALGLLALGHRGLILWREARAQAESKSNVAEEPKQP